jgi:hypothetical protein
MFYMNPNRQCGVVGLVALLSIFYLQVAAQVSKAVDLNKVPPVWVWKKSKVENQGNIWEPYRKELQRIFQPLPDGIHSSYLFFYGDRPAMPGTSARWYTVTLMLKKFEYSPQTKLIKQEGETGCWIYCQVNTITNDGGVVLPGLVDGLRMKNTENQVFVCNLRTELDAAGNKVLYASSRGVDNQLIGHYFSYNQQLPIRQVTKKELFDMYQVYMEKTLEDAIDRHKKSKSGLEYIPGLQKQIDELNRWHSEQMRRKDLSTPAVVENIFANIDPQVLDVKDGFHVWTDDARFFDSTKHRDEPQFVILRIRRQDADLPKKQFVDRYSDALNLDIIARLTGDQLKRPGGINSITNSLETSKKETAAGLAAGAQTHAFAKDAPGSFPGGWLGTKNIQVQDYQGGRWLALNKPGYWYPKQFGKPLQDGFQLNCALEWNKALSYYSGVFAITLAELPYDQVLQGFKTSDRGIVYESFYDQYTPGFHRIVLKFDPHFNDGGQLEVFVHAPSGQTLLTRKFLLPNFFREKNSHRLQVGRQGNTLWVKDNDELIAELDNAFQPNVSYNAYVFSRYKVNNDGENDTYFLNDISVRYK